MATQGSADTIWRRLDRLPAWLSITAMIALAIGVSALLAVLAVAIRPAFATEPDARSVSSALATRLPRTRISAVDCTKLPGLCEVAAGSTLFYTDPKARYLVIGRVYDMETRTDLTATRLLELNPDTLLAGAPHNDAEGEGRPGAPAAPAAPVRVPLAELPRDGAITWGKLSGTKVVVFSDFRCGYCRQLSDTLRQLNVKVEERPISVLGTRKLSEAVYCSRDKVSALHAAYAGETPEARACDTSGLDANEAFARKHGFTGTPVIVRADGEVIQGFRPAPALAAWLKAKTAA